MVGNSFGIMPTNDKITVIKQDNTPSLDDWGNPVYKEDRQEYKCTLLYNYKNDVLEFFDGKVQIYTAKVYIRGLVPIDRQDKVEFVDLTGNTASLEINNVYPVRDFRGKVLYTCVVV